MNKLSNRFLFLLSLFVASAFLGSCKSSSTGPGSSNIKTPGVGSFFITEEQTLDSNGTVISSYFDTATVAQAGLTVMGKTNVVAMNLGVPDLQYYNYEPNGDLSYLTDDAGPEEWGTIPFGSQGMTQLPAQSGSGFHETKTAVGAGTGSVIVNGQSFSTEKVIVTSVFTDTLFNETSQDTTIDTAQFAPAIGWIVSEETPGTRDHILGVMSSTRRSVLVDYKLY
jgi:hypothetical protein